MSWFQLSLREWFLIVFIFAQFAVIWVMQQQYHALQDYIRESEIPAVLRQPPSDPGK